VCDSLVGGIPSLGHNPPILRTVHLADAPSGRLRGVQLIRGSLDDVTDSDGRLCVRERGLRFAVDLGLDAPYRPRPGTGRFLDQRDNRSRVRDRASGGRWLNLFCHTGSLSVAALTGGASEVVSVDLSAPYLRWLAANLALNDLAAAPHRSVQMDARRYVERLGADELFDGILCDPPTAARAGRRFWSVRKGGGELVAECLKHLRPGGALLLCRNDRGARGTLAPLVQEVAKAEGLSLASVDAAPPGADFPSSSPFPEGDAFDGVWAVRA
jgi:23S rRNA (guanine2445-N2)-methyltransferase / 23S rRNA (guanine2069-N7)-methyltransferase